MSKIEANFDQLNNNVVRDIANVVSEDITRHLSANPQDALAIMRNLSGGNGSGMPSDFPDVSNLIDFGNLPNPIDDLGRGLPNPLKDLGRGFPNLFDDGLPNVFEDIGRHLPHIPNPLEDGFPNPLDDIRHNLPDLPNPLADLNRPFKDMNDMTTRDFANTLKQNLVRDLNVNPEHAFDIFDRLQGGFEEITDHLPGLPDIFGGGHGDYNERGSYYDPGDYFDLPNTNYDNCWKPHGGVELDKRGNHGDEDDGPGFWSKLGHAAGDIAGNVIQNHNDGGDQAENHDDGGDDDGPGIWSQIGSAALKIVPFFL